MRIKSGRTRREGASAKGIFRFAVQLLSGPIAPAFVASHPEPPLRVIDILGDQTLEDLHLAVFEAFDREDAHMYEFQIGGKKPMDRKAARYGVILDDDFAGEADVRDAAATSIAALPIKTGSHFFYWFDFGDDWWHEIRLLAVDPPAKGSGQYPRLVEKRGESPPQYADWEDEGTCEPDMPGTVPHSEDAATMPEKSRLDAISGLMADFCESRLSREYGMVCDQLFAAIRATWLPWQRGKAQSWAAGLVHAAGMINFLHDPTSEPHMKLRDIAGYFGVSPATMENKSREIRDTVNAFPLDPRFCLPERLMDSPLLWVRPINGILVDMRTQPREVQEAALKAGLIPFLPEARVAPVPQTPEEPQKQTTEKEKPAKDIPEPDQYSLFE